MKQKPGVIAKSGKVEATRKGLSWGIYNLDIVMFALKALDTGWSHKAQLGVWSMK